MRRSITGTLLLLTAFHCQAAGIDCGKAGTATEKAICANSELLHLDTRMDRTYINALLRSDDRKAVQTSQKNWLRQGRDSCQDDETCLQRVYKQRIQSLYEYGRSGGSWLGLWYRIDVSMHESADLSIRSVLANGFQFELQALSGATVDRQQGDAQFASSDGDGAGLYTDADSGCSLRFTPLWQQQPGNACLRVEPSDACVAGGAQRVRFDGTYCQESERDRHPTPRPVLEAEILAAETIDEFKQLVGPDYEQFLSTFHLVNETADLDGFDAKVHTGSVRGLMGYMEGIVMQSSNGKLYAAVLRDEQIQYYSNDPRYKHQLPETIDSWAEHLYNHEVVFH